MFRETKTSILLNSLIPSRVPQPDSIACNLGHTEQASSLLPRAEFSLRALGTQLFADILRM